MDNLKKMLEQKGLRVLDLASPSCRPGRLIKMHYFWRFGDFMPEVRLDEDRGLATEVLQVAGLALTPRVPSDIVLQNVTDQFQMSAGVGLPQLGLIPTGDINSGVTITWNISPVETISFGDNDVQAYFSSVLPNLRKFVNSDPKNNGWIKEVFFAATVSGTIDGKTVLAQAGVTVNANLWISWSADKTTFVIQGSNQVPFACRGDVVG
jgi:hypothetical protein